MTDDPKRLQDMLERATAPAAASGPSHAAGQLAAAVRPADAAEDWDPETSAFRDVWLEFAKLIEAEQHPLAGGLSDLRPREEDARRQRGREPISPAQRSGPRTGMMAKSTADPFWQCPPDDAPVLGQTPGQTGERPSVMPSTNVALAVADSKLADSKRAGRKLWSGAALAASLLLAAAIGLTAAAINRFDGPRANPQTAAQATRPAAQSPPQLAKSTIKSESKLAVDSLVAAKTRIAAQRRVASEPRGVAAQPRIAATAGSTKEPLQWTDSVDDDITAVGNAATWVQQDWYTQSSSVVSIQSGIDDLEQEIEGGAL